MKLSGFAELPADTFAGGPPSGQYDAEGNLLEQPLYEGQPVQGFSGVQFADKNSYWFLADNGFGSKLNSQDYLLRLYRVDPNFQGGKGDQVEVEEFIQFSDPDQQVPFSIKNQDTADRLLTGFDFDLESFVIADDGSFWVGEEFGPYLLHFDATGKLLEPPIPTPNFGPNDSTEIVRSPDHPAVLAGEAEATLGRSKGYEGLAINPDKTKLYALLEGAVEGDPEDMLRINEFDLASKAFTELKGNYRLEDLSHAIGDVAVVNENEYLVIERDGKEGEEAQFKKIFKIDLSQQDAEGYVAKTEVVDLLNIQDPLDLNADGSQEFRFPFVTIEDVLVYDKDTLVVANDNNYRRVGGRPPEPDQTEILLVDLEQPLDLDPQVGIQAFRNKGLIAGTPDNDQLLATQGDRVFGGEGNDILDASGGGGKNRLYGGDGNDELLAGHNDRLFGEAGHDILDATAGLGGSRLYGGAGDDELFAGKNDWLSGGPGQDTLFAGAGDNTLTGGEGVDQFWIVAADTPKAVNTITDFQPGTDRIGLGSGLAFANLQFQQVGADTQITLKEGEIPLATLKNMAADSLSIANFVSTAPRPLIIGHRGASGLRPEHTLASYELAIQQGADFIEPDLVSTKDGVLIARHENAIAIVDPATSEITEATTDVAERPEFSDRLSTKVIDGQEITGWFTEDFTLAEIKTLRAQERLPELRPDSAQFDGQFEIPTLEEIINLAQEKGAELGRTIGLYPETKHPTYFDSIDLSLEEPLVAALESSGYTEPTDPVFIQSFEVGNLRDLNGLTDLPLVQLLGGGGQPYDFAVNDDPRTYADLTAPDELLNIAEYADGIGPSKRLIIPAETVDRNGDGEPDDLNGDGQISDADRFLQQPTPLIDDAHAAGLVVHPYTFRSEDFFLAQDYQGEPVQEYEQFFSLGVDGLFSDYPGTAFEVASRLYPMTAPDPLAGVGLLAPLPSSDIG